MVPGEMQCLYIPRKFESLHLMTRISNPSTGSCIVALGRPPVTYWSCRHRRGSLFSNCWTIRWSHIHWKWSRNCLCSRDRSHCGLRLLLRVVSRRICRTTPTMEIECPRDLGRSPTWPLLDLYRLACRLHWLHVD